MAASGSSLELRILETEANPIAPVTPKAMKLAVAEKHIGIDLS
jgi:hypothetical protein